MNIMIEMCGIHHLQNCPMSVRPINHEEKLSLSHWSKKLQSDLDLFKNALGQPKTLSLEGETLNDVNVVLRAQDIVAMKNRFRTHPGNIMLNRIMHPNS